MTSMTLTINELLVIILAIAGMNWSIITLALAPLKQSIRDQKALIETLFARSNGFLTKAECEKSMATCKQIREAESHGSGKKHN